MLVLGVGWYFLITQVSSWGAVWSSVGTEGHGRVQSALIQLLHAPPGKSSVDFRHYRSSDEIRFVRDERGIYILLRCAGLAPEAKQRAKVYFAEFGETLRREQLVSPDGTQDGVTEFYAYHLGRDVTLGSVILTDLLRVVYLEPRPMLEVRVNR